jgi:hypothetical protein
MLPGQFFAQPGVVGESEAAGSQNLKLGLAKRKITGGLHGLYLEILTLTCGNRVHVGFVHAGFLDVPPHVFHEALHREVLPARETRRDEMWSVGFRNNFKVSMQKCVLRLMNSSKSSKMTCEKRGKPLPPGCGVFRYKKKARNVAFCF